MPSMSMNLVTPLTVRMQFLEFIRMTFSIFKLIFIVIIVDIPSTSYRLMNLSELLIFQELFVSII